MLESYKLGNVKGNGFLFYQLWVRFKRMEYGSDLYALHDQFGSLRNYRVSVASILLF